MGAGGFGSALLFLYTTLHFHGFNWITEIRVWPAWLIILGIFPILYLSLRADQVAAGADWVQSGKQWVRTYELTSITLKPSGPNLMLQLIDRDGRKVRMSWSRIQDNRELWDLVYNGILHSVYLGHAEVDSGARHHLKLPCSPS